MRSRVWSVMRCRAAPSTSSRLAWPTTSRMALSLTSRSVASTSLTWNSTFTGSMFTYWMAERISTRFTSAVSILERYSTLLTWETLTLVTVSMGQGKAQPQPSLRTSVKRPKRCTTPLSEALIWNQPDTSHSTTSTAAMMRPKLPGAVGPSVPTDPSPLPPESSACNFCCQSFRGLSLPPDFPAGRFLPQGDSPRFPGSFHAILIQTFAAVAGAGDRVTATRIGDGAFCLGILGYRPRLEQVWPPGGGLTGPVRPPANPL